MAAQPSSVKTSSSWIQLSLFTAFLFLLVAIPYTIYLKSIAPPPPTLGALTPEKVPQQKITTISPPPGSASTSCIAAPESFMLSLSATSSAYILETNGKQVCFPPTLPPFPFQWDSYKDFVNNYSIDIPTNWTEKTLGKTHNFYADAPSATSAADISFGVVTADPFATNTAMLKAQTHKLSSTGTIYTKGRDIIAVVFPLTKGFFVMQASTADSAFYAFQHMLTSLSINE